ncbi:hypothetical protein FJNA_21060 [Thermus sp. FJN-A]
MVTVYQVWGRWEEGPAGGLEGEGPLEGSVGVLWVWVPQPSKTKTKAKTPSHLCIAITSL